MSSRRSRSGGKSDLDRVEPEQQVLAEAPFVGQLVGRQVGRGDDPHVDRHRPVGPDRDDLALLERGQQLGLEVERQIADLVEEQRAAVGRLEPADAVAAGAGEGALHMAEQLGLEQALRRSRRGRPRPSARRCAATGGGFRARRSPCRCRSRRG